jgi:hypothetical protein
LILSSVINQTTAVRGNDTFKITVKVSDGDSLDRIRMKLTTMDPKTGGNWFLSGYSEIISLDDDDSTFTKDCTVPYTAAVGTMQIVVDVYDLDIPTSKDTALLEIMILNNPPEITNFSINQKTDGDFSFKGNMELNFGFVASDPENKLKYAKVSITSEAGGEFKTYNYTFDMTSNNANFSIYTKDLPYGEYTVYGFVIDSEGAESKFASAYNLIILEDRSGAWTPWVMLLIGIASGLIIGIFILSTKYKKEDTRITRDLKSNKSGVVEQKTLSPAQKKKMREMRKIGKQPKSDRSVDIDSNEVLDEGDDENGNEEEQPEEEKPVKKDISKPQTKFKKRV